MLGVRLLNPLEAFKLQTQSLIAQLESRAAAFKSNAINGSLKPAGLGRLT
jgi:hypothetical protein